MEIEMKNLPNILPNTQLGLSPGEKLNILSRILLVSLFENNFST
jgi:hypothetical protein